MNQNLFFPFFACTFNLFYHVPSFLATPIIGGAIDKHHNFTFHVSIHVIMTNRYEYACGGTIIDERYILTAAHCFMNKERGIVRKKMSIEKNQPKIIAGTNLRNGPGIEREIVKIFIPNTFETIPVNYADIAVAKLRDDIGVANHTDRIKIAPLGLLLEDENKQATICGFGYYQFERRQYGLFHLIQRYSDIIRFLSITMSGRENCYNYQAVICARNVGRAELGTACHGDSGSGLIYETTIVGVLSRGSTRCNSNEIPMRFTRLSAFRKFIKNAMNERGDYSKMYVIEEHSTLHPSSPHCGGLSPGSSPPQGPKRGSRKSGLPKFLDKIKNVVGCARPQ